MPVTAQDYFRIVFDIYPVAWDESPFLYRILNKSREEVALDVNYNEKYRYTFLTNVPISRLFLLTPFLKVYRVAYVLKEGQRVFLDRKGADYIYETKIKPRFPIYYIIENNKTIAFIPPNYNAKKDDVIEVIYCPFIPELNTLTSVDTVLSDEFKYLVALRVVMKLAINDQQYQLYDFFRTQYLLELGRLTRGRI